MSGQIFEQHVDERSNVSVRISDECVVLTHEEAERIKAKFDQLEAENANLRRELADTEACQADTDGPDCGHVRNLSAYEAGYRDGSVHYELEHCPACKNIADLQEALEENAKLRECVAKAWSLFIRHGAVHTYDLSEVDAVRDGLRELGIEVPL